MSLIAQRRSKNSGFTIVELLIVIVVIAILAAITIVAYNGISSRAKESSLKSDLRSGATQLGKLKVETNAYPSNANGLKKNNDISFTYNTSNDTYCLAGSITGLAKTFHITQNGLIEEGDCPSLISDGTAMQIINSANCPATRTRGVDVRDNHTYWIQKMSDDKCWMLTNLAYAGAGDNTYGDARSMTQGVSANTFTEARYFVPTTAYSFTAEPTNPSTSDDGTGQYGYFYNWCAAMGGQLSTTACSTSPNTPIPAENLPNTDISVCPAGWRLPSSTEYTALNTAINQSRFNTDEGYLKGGWLGQRAGSMSNGTVSYDGVRGFYWSSTISNPSNYTTGRNAFVIRYYPTSVSTTGVASSAATGMAVRCVAS